MRLQDIQGAYEGFLAQFQSVCHGGNYQLRYQASTRPVTQSNNTRISVSALLYLKEWPYKVVTKQKTIDILVSSTEHFDAAGEASVYSNVHVNYLAVDRNGAAEIVENIHYDFQADPDAAHPFFHAQFANNQVSYPGGTKGIGFTYSIKTAGNPARYKNLRVPTAHMNLPSVLVSLAADHMKSHIFKDVLALVQKKENALPEAACSRMRQAFAQGTGFCRSAYWY